MPCCHAIGAAGRESRDDGLFGKPSETAGRKVTGTKAVGNEIELNQLNREIEFKVFEIVMSA